MWDFDLTERHLMSFSSRDPCWVCMSLKQILTTPISLSGISSAVFPKKPADRVVIAVCGIVLVASACVVARAFLPERATAASSPGPVRDANQSYDHGKAHAMGAALDALTDTGELKPFPQKQLER